MPTIERARHGSTLLDQEQAIQQQIGALQRQQADLAAGDWTLGMLA